MAATIEGEGEILESTTAEAEKSTKKPTISAEQLAAAKTAASKAASVAFSTARLFVGVALVVVTGLQFVGGGVNNMTLFTAGLLLLISALLLIKR